MKNSDLSKLITIFLLLTAVGLAKSEMTEAQEICGADTDTLFNNQTQPYGSDFIQQIGQSDSLSHLIAYDTLSIPNFEMGSNDFYQRLNILAANTRFFLRDAVSGEVIPYNRAVNLVDPKFEFLRMLMLMQMATAVDSAEEMRALIDSNKIEFEDIQNGALRERVNEYTEANGYTEVPQEVAAMLPILSQLDHRLNIVIDLHDIEVYGEVAMSYVPINTIFIPGSSYTRRWDSPDAVINLLKYPHSAIHEWRHIYGDPVIQNSDGTLGYDHTNEDGSWYSMTEEESQRLTELFNNPGTLYSSNYMSYAFSHPAELLPVMEEILRSEIATYYSPLGIPVNREICGPDDSDLLKALEALTGIFGIETDRWAEVLDLPPEVFSRENLPKLLGDVSTYFPDGSILPTEGGF